VKAGQLISFTVSGSDPDQPAQTIAFSLDIAPSGASINGSSGVFSWTPTTAQVGTTAVRVRVTDNGAPNLSATADFNIVVTPAQNGAITIDATMDASDHPALTWTAQIGVTYRVEYKNALEDATWTLLNQTTAQTVSVSVTDPNPGQQRFYRVVAP
jgi:hypothetical protein